jgi:hypothetical protein
VGCSWARPKGCAGRKKKKKRKKSKVGQLRIRPKPVSGIEIPLDIEIVFTNPYTCLNSNQI